MKTSVSTLIVAVLITASFASAQNQSFVSLNSGSARQASVLKAADDDDEKPAPDKKAAKKDAKQPAGDAANSALKNAVGGLTAQGLIMPYFAVATLGDAYAKKSYTKEVTAEMLGRYEGLLKNITKMLEALPEKAGFDEDEAGSVKSLLKGYNAVGEMITAFKAFMEDGEEKSAQKFEAARMKAQKIMDELFK